MKSHGSCISGAVYPTLEMDEEDQEQMLKGHSKPSRDDTWNPKGRTHILCDIIMMVPFKQDFYNTTEIFNTHN